MIYLRLCVYCCVCIHMCMYCRCVHMCTFRVWTCISIYSTVHACTLYIVQHMWYVWYIVQYVFVCMCGMYVHVFFRVKILLLYKNTMVISSIESNSLETLWALKRARIWYLGLKINRRIRTEYVLGASEHRPRPWLSLSCAWHAQCR